MTSVWVVFVLIFAVVQLCTAEYVVYGQKMTLDNNLSLNRFHHPFPAYSGTQNKFCVLKPILSLKSTGLRTKLTKFSHFYTNPIIHRNFHQCQKSVKIQDSFECLQYLGYINLPIRSPVLQCDWHAWAQLEFLHFLPQLPYSTQDIASSAYSCL